MFARLVPWFLIAATPALFAIATWDTAPPYHPVQSRALFYGSPVLAIEILVIGYSLLFGFEPLRTVRASPAWVQLALLILVIVGLFTAVFVAATPLVAGIRTMMWLIHLLFALCVAHEAAANPSLVKRFLWPAVVTGLCAYALMLIVYVALIPDPGNFDWLALRLAVGNVRQLGFYSAAGVSAALGVAILHTRWSGYAASVAAAALLFALSFWSGTRGSILAAWVAFGLALLWFRRLRSMRAIGALVISSGAGALLSLLHSVPNGHYGIGRIAVSSADRGIDHVSSGRLDMWVGTYQAILQRPLFGYGESQFRMLAPESPGAFNHPHNALLQILFQWGLVGGICFLALAAWVVWKAHRALAAQRENHLPAFLVTASLLIMSLFEGTLYHAYPIMMIALGVAIIIGSGRELGSRDYFSPVPDPKATSDAPNRMKVA